MVDAALVLVLAPARGAVPIRLPITKAITSIGSDHEADINLATAPSRWVVIHRETTGLSVRRLSSGERYELGPGRHIDIDGIGLACERVAAQDDAVHTIEAMAGALAAADTPEEALEHILAGAIAGTAASTGAVIVSDEGAYRVALARDASGAVLDGAELLSDTIVRDVLGSGERLCLSNLASHERYARIPSVVSLHLQSVLCLPMRVEGRTLGALYLGKRDAREPFADRVVADLKVLTALSVPFVAQLRRSRARAAVGGDELLGDSEVMREVRRLVARVGPSNLSVLLLGASGTGKELIARAIHAASPRAAAPLIALNCASVPESLLAAELFGYCRGAFTGATSDRKGMIEAAAGSTLFLDEIGDMALAMQAALLRVLEQREVKRLGETRSRSVDFRLVAATNRDLSAEVAAGRFREDLLFRIEELTIELPLLVERGDDVILLAQFFLHQADAQLSLPLHSLGEDAQATLRAHRWPGNVRELRATMRRAAVMADTKIIEPGDLRLGAETLRGPTGAGLAVGDLERPLAEARDEFVKRYVNAVVERHGGNRESAASALAIGVRTLYRYLT